MVEQQQEPAVLRRIMRNESPDERRLPHIQAIAPGIEPPPQLRRRIPAPRIEFNLLHRQRRFAPDHLHRLAQTFPNHSRAQDVVPPDHRLQRRDKAVQPLPPVKRQQGGR